MTTLTYDAAVSTARRGPDRVDNVDNAHTVIARAMGALALAGISLIHLLDLPGKIKETPYVGMMYVGLIVAAAVLAMRLVTRGDARTWLLSAAVAGSAIGGYVVSRTTGLPAAGQDIGNWLEPLGMASLFVETTVIALAASLLPRPRVGRG